MPNNKYKQTHAMRKKSSWILALGVSTALPLLANTTAYAQTEESTSSPSIVSAQSASLRQSEAIVCVAHPIQSANSDDPFDSPYSPSRAIDGNFGAESRWSSKGDGRSIIFDLGSEQTVNSIGTAWYRADRRQAFFDVATSDDGDTWNRVFTGAVAENGEDLKIFDLDESEARYVQIIGRGNSQSDWNSILEVVVGECSEPQNPEPPEPPGSCDRTDSLAIFNVTSEGDFDDDFSPTRAVDNDLDTESRWSANGIGRTITFDLGEISTVRQVNTAWYRANIRQAFFDVETSADNRSWQTVLSGAVATGTQGLIDFDVAESEARYVRIVGQGNSDSNWNSLIEANIFGCGIEEVPAPPNPIVDPPTPIIEPPVIDPPTPVVDPPTPVIDPPTPVVDPPTPVVDPPTPIVDPPVIDPPTPVIDPPTPIVDPPIIVTGPLPPSELNTVPDIDCTIEVSNASQLEDNTGFGMSAGTTVCLLDGTYRDIEFEVGGNGSESRPITVAARNPGSVFIEGESQVRMSGTHVVFQGLVFRNGNSAGGDLFQTRGAGNAPCDHCRITEVTVTDWDNEFDDSNRWLLIYGQNNRIDHSWFSGKSTRGALLTVDRGEISDPDYAQIDHNYFGDRLPFSGGEFPGASDNEFEGIRIGTSDTQAFPSFSRIEYNYMERMRGEAEVISNKSGSNVISHNTIRSSYGALVNRHGGGSIISNNFIFSDGYGMSGGIRIAGADHQVVNNYIEGCTFTGSSFNGGIVLTKTDGSQATSGYQQVDNVLIAHNTLVNCVDSIKLEGGRSSSSTLPTNVQLVNNVVVDAVGPVFVGDIPPTTTVQGNYFGGDSLGLDSAPSGVTFGDPSFRVADDGLRRPSSSSPVIGGGVRDYIDVDSLSVDMDGQRRSNPDSGADEVSNATSTDRPLTASDVGPRNYRP